MADSDGAQASRGQETELGLVRRARRMHRVLAQTHPDAHCELDFTNPLELAVATILSAQCTDQTVNKATPALFRRYRTAADYAAADRDELESLVKTCGFFRNKTTSLIRLGQTLVQRYGGELPATMKDLDSLPGMGRKTANVVLGNAFGIPGIAVDTHVARLVGRWRWTTATDPVKIEHAVGKLIERRDWTMLSHRVIFHGRRVCHARKPACGACTLAADCPAYGTGPTGFEAAAKLIKSSRADELIAMAAAMAPTRPAKPRNTGPVAAAQARSAARSAS